LVRFDVVVVDFRRQGNGTLLAAEEVRLSPHSDPFQTENFSLVVNGAHI
jgi:hypothetical protein